ncbi:MAG: hypothetical protein FWH41_10805, partial [Treponema sp.]|nr:hypothetical protein [Treponema sp.]
MSNEQLAMSKEQRKGNREKGIGNRGCCSGNIVGSGKIHELTNRSLLEQPLVFKFCPYSPIPDPRSPIPIP